MSNDLQDPRYSTDPDVQASAPPASEAAPRRRRAAKRPVSGADTPAVATEAAGPAESGSSSRAAAETTSEEPPVEKPKRGRRRAAAEPTVAAADVVPTPPSEPEPVAPPAVPEAAEAEAVAVPAPSRRRPGPVAPVFQAAERIEPVAVAGLEDEDIELDSVDVADGPLDGEAADETVEDGGPRRRRRRGRRGRGRGRGDGVGDPDAPDGDGESADTSDAADGEAHDAEAADGEGEDDSASSTRRRRRRRRGSGGDVEPGADDPPNTVTRIREPRTRRSPDADGVRGVSGSTRLEAKRQRRRDGRNERRRAPIVTEAEFLARREAVDRRMIVRNQGERTQIAVLEDGVLVEHYVTRASATAFAGNVYVGKVQNVLPSMEAAFVDIGKGRNAVLYAGEVNYDAAGFEGNRPRTIQEALKSGQTVLVQVSKDPIGQKGARLTSQITLPGRYLVYVPEGSMTGISRKLPDTERARLKSILKRIVPEEAGVIIRTAAEGASEEDLVRDVERLVAQWESIKAAAAKAEKKAPALVHAEPDLVVRVVRDVFNEDFGSLVVQGDAEWAQIEPYLSSVAPELMERVSRWTGSQDVFTEHRVDEQLMKALDRKVHLPSGGSLVIDRTEAMTVVDVNTGKFTGKGGNLEETVTKNNLEAAEEIVRQLRLRDVGGIIVIDFIDMVLESNRELVLRRLTECLGRDRTRHQVAEVTSLGLVQMTRKRVGTGLLEAYSETCATCNGRGVLIHLDGPPPHHPPAPALVVPARPVPRPPLRRPDSESDEAPELAGDEVSTEVAETAAAQAAAADETPTVPTEASPAEVAVAIAVAPAPLAPRRRRRATSKGPVSAPVTDDAGVPGGEAASPPE